ncbi:hypothetical protein HanRHA438_Chr16g0782321 [Helianthus annuus]|nr:hypothetical protein HanRHA438_Chr16g0782321 [Helianthus annuus]
MKQAQYIECLKSCFVLTFFEVIDVRVSRSFIISFFIHLSLSISLDINFSISNSIILLLIKIIHNQPPQIFF